MEQTDIPDILKTVPDSLVEARLDTMLRTLASLASKDPKGEWSEKYGTNFENDIFKMSKFCWCEKDNCQLCEGNQPNFLYKPTGFALSWYKYIGRGMELSGSLTLEQAMAMETDCVHSLGALQGI